MRGPAIIAIFMLSGCSHFPWDYAAQNARIANCYDGVTPNDVTACLSREEMADPAYPVAYKPGSGAFCSPDLDKRDCRQFLETANTPQDLPATPITEP